jgi:hypothetical protein
MQLLLTVDELQVTVDVLEQRSRELMSEIARTERADFKYRLQNRQHFLDELENKLIRRDLQLSADELDVLATELSQCDRALILECAKTSHRDFRDSLMQREHLLLRVRDKVTEACAMG